MKNSNSEKSSKSKKHGDFKSCSRLTVFSFLIFFLFLILISIILFILFQQEIFTFNQNNNSILIPKGKVLYDLHTLTFRDRSLYRSKLEYLVLNEGSEEKRETYRLMKDDLESNDVVIVSTSPHEEEKIKMRCSGRCDCYLEEQEEEWKRRSLSLVYSHRYSAVVFVSILGYAFSRFVDENIDECYRNARNSLGYEDAPITCFYDEEEDCDAEEDYYWSMKKRGNVHRYECEGNCINNHKEIDKQTLDVRQFARQFNCFEEVVGPLFMIVKKTDAQIYGMDPDTLALLKFRFKYLLPFCKTIEIPTVMIGSETDFALKATYAMKEREYFNPCIGEDEYMKIEEHIRCEKLEDFENPELENPDFPEMDNPDFPDNTE